MPKADDGGCQPRQGTYGAAVEGRVVQWTERARLEQHPENPAPYNVLLGRLGAEALERRGIDWRSLPSVDSAPRGCRYFVETRHALCADFLRYWSSHGQEFDRRPGKSFAESLTLFGYPLSEARMEQGADLLMARDGLRQGCRRVEHCCRVLTVGAQRRYVLREELQAWRIHCKHPAVVPSR